MNPSKRVLFYRDLTMYTGGHLKVFDYFKHLTLAEGFIADISFSPASRWDEFNPWFSDFQQRQVDYSPANYDYVFLGGMDWEAYLASAPNFRQPIINLIQHVRHADPKEVLFNYLANPAIRICVSSEVERAIVATGNVNGPVFTIANGLDLPDFANAKKQWDVIILGRKQPPLAQHLAEKLRQKGLGVNVILEWIPREELYQLMSESQIALLLPNFTEGFYLPALEAMKYCDLTLVPDCIGNRDFCFHEKNCLMPGYNAEALLAAVDSAQALLANAERAGQLKKSATETVAKHSLQREQFEFLNIMNRIDELWSSFKH